MKGSSTIIRIGDPHTFEKHCLLLVLGNVESAEFRLRCAGARAEIAAAIADQVKRRNALGDAGGMIDVGRHLHDSVADPNILRPLAARGEKHFRRGGMRVLFEEMMLSRPDVVVAQAVGKFDLLKSVLDQRVI